MGPGMGPRIGLEMGPGIEPTTGPKNRCAFSSSIRPKIEPKIGLSFCPLQFLTAYYSYCGRVECPAPEKSPDLGNSSPNPRAFMYIESATDLSGKQARNIHLKDRRFVRRSRTRTGLRLGGRGQDLRTGVTDTD